MHLMNDSWIGPIGTLLLIGCCMLLETGLVGGRLAAMVAASGSKMFAPVAGGVLALTGIGR